MELLRQQDTGGTDNLPVELFRSEGGATRSVPEDRRRPNTAVRRPSRLSLPYQQKERNYRRTLARLLLVSLAFASINTALATLVSAGTATEHWYLYLSPVLVAALTFGLRGGLLASSAAVVIVTTLDLQVLSFMAEERSRLHQVGAALLAPSLPLTLPFSASSEAALTAATTLSQDAVRFGAHIWRALVSIAVLCLTGAIVGWEVDVGRRREQALRALARRDPLTDALSQSVWLEMLDDELRRAKRYGRAFSVLVLDIDALRRVNALWGRSAGDRALRHLSGVLRPHIRGVDRLGRVGGDELGLLLPENDRDAGGAVAQRLLRVVGTQPVELIDGRTVDLGVSVGVVGYPDDGDSRESLLVAAEEALGRAKAVGGRAWAVPVGTDAVAGMEPKAVELTGPRIVMPWHRARRKGPRTGRR